MENQTISRDRYYPYYIQIRHILLDRINNGVYEYGKRLPAESILAKEFSVTRVTLRKALEMLREEGVLTSSRGIGWTVIHRRIEQKLTSSYWFGLEVGDTGMSTKSTIINTSLGPIPSSVQRYFRQEDLGQSVYEIVRLRSYQESPISLEYSYVPEHIARGIDQRIKENESLIQLLRGTYHISVGRSTEYLSPQLSRPYESELLSIHLDSPVFETTRMTFSTSHKIIEVRRSIIRGDKVVFRKDFP
jgi:GntR family transcriptional regulator